MSSNNIPLKLLRGYKDNLPTTIEDGMIYYCIDSNELFFDYVNNSTTPPTEHRYCLNPIVGETDYGDPVGKGLVSPEDKEIIDTAVRFVEQQLEPEQQKQARLNINAVGENVTGKVFTNDDIVAVTASDGAEIFNDYETNIASGLYSHAENSKTTAIGDYSHAEGYLTLASGAYSHVEGFDTGATGEYSHAEGLQTLANNRGAHAEGNTTHATGIYSHAEGVQTIAQGSYSHAEGSGSDALGLASHAEGNGTIASSEAQHAQGKNNIKDADGIYAHIVGNGETAQARSNAHTLDWEGNAWFAGDVYIGGTSMDDATKLEAAKPYMTKITLTTTDWDTTTLTQVATIEGIKADETAQAIYINPVFDDTMIDEIGNCNVYASAQGENSITFSCDSIPTIDVEFYVKWQDVKWIKPILPPPNLIDFEYIYNDEADTYTLTSWKETTNGVAGTEIIIPNDERIII